MKKALLSLLLAFTLTLVLQAQPQPTSYYLIYDFLDEMASEGVISLHGVVRPYARETIGEKLLEIQQQDLKVPCLNKRQRKDLYVFLNDYSLEIQAKDYAKGDVEAEIDSLQLWSSYRYHDTTWKLWPTEMTYFKQGTSLRVRPILGMTLLSSSKGLQVKRWYGANFEMQVNKYLDIWGSLRDQSYDGSYLNEDDYPTDNAKMYGARLTSSGYLNTLPGVQYKEADYGGDYSDSRGGIRLHASWGSVALQKECVTWGPSKHSSNILSGRAPSFPMVALQLKPTPWFTLDYMHASLVSNVLDSTNYYVEENYTLNTSKRHYRPASKYLAMMMLTFRPMKQVYFSIGNSVVYGEDHIEAAYLIPLAFYKSEDHTMTKGLATENQNSQLFLTLTAYPVKHLYVYASAFIDEVKFERFSPSNDESNPISWQLGLELTNWPLKNLGLYTEFTQTNIITYEHSIKQLDWTSNSYLLGNYMGANAREFYVALKYHPLSRLELETSFTQGTKYNLLPYYRKGVTSMITETPFDEKVWQNQTLTFKASYELMPNAYAILGVSWNDAQAYQVTGTGNATEELLTPQEINDKFTPLYYQGSNLTFTAGFSLGF